MNISSDTLELFGLSGASKIINFNFVIQTIFCSMLFFIIDGASRSIAKLFGVDKQYDQLNEKARIEWDQRTVSMIHAIIVVPLSIICIYHSLGQDPLFYYSDTAYYTLMISGGYFLWDIKVSFSRPDIVGISMCAHALLGFFATQYVNLLHVPNLYVTFTASMLISEISTIPLNFKGFVQVVNPKSPYYEKSLLVFAVLFLTSRCVWCLYTTLEVVYLSIVRLDECALDKVVILAGAAVVSLYLNLTWGYMLIRKMKQKFTGARESSRPSSSTRSKSVKAN